MRVLDVNGQIKRHVVLPDKAILTSAYLVGLNTPSRLVGGRSYRPPLEFCPSRAYSLSDRHTYHTVRYLDMYFFN